MNIVHGFMECKLFWGEGELLQEFDQLDDVYTELESARIQINYYFCKDERKDMLDEVFTLNYMSKIEGLRQ